MLKRIKAYFKPFFNIRFLICFITAWMITNGWSYIALVIGQSFNIKWLRNVAATYLAFLWLPATPEKLITIPIALFFHRSLFKNDYKTKQLLLDMKKQAKEDWEKVKIFLIGGRRNARRKLTRRTSSKYWRRHSKG